MARTNPALADFWNAKARNRVLYGGRSSSKSWDAAAVIILIASSCKIRVLCVRQFQNKIEESVYTLLKIQIDRFGLTDKFRVLDNKIICIATGSEFMFYGLWRHIGEIKSIESIDILWSEESHLLSKEQWEILEPTIRREGSECWFIFNPKLSTDFVWRRFVVNPPPDTIIRRINHDENPFLSSTMIKIIYAAKAENEEDYNHIYLGIPKDDDEGSIIKRSHVLAAIDAHITLGIEIRGARRLGFDVADDGEDSCAMIESIGSLVAWADLWKAKEDELLKSCTRVWHEARTRKASVIYDAIGVGAASGAKFNELNQGEAEIVSHSKYFAGGAPTKPDSNYGLTGIKNRDFFSNIKAQSWWIVADRLRNTYNAVKNGHKFDDSEMIFIASDLPHLDKLIDELCTPKRDYDKAGRVMVESKKELAKRDIPSPNLADAFIMANETLKINSWDQYK
jgi:phage terminase large subunit